MEESKVHATEDEKFLIKSSDYHLYPVGEVDLGQPSPPTLNTDFTPYEGFRASRGDDPYDSFLSTPTNGQRYEAFRGAPEPPPAVANTPGGLTNALLPGRKASIQEIALVARVRLAFVLIALITSIIVLVLDAVTLGSYNRNKNNVKASNTAWRDAWYPTSMDMAASYAFIIIAALSVLTLSFLLLGSFSRMIRELSTPRLVSITGLVMAGLTVSWYAIAIVYAYGKFDQGHPTIALWACQYKQYDFMMKPASSWTHMCTEGEVAKHFSAATAAFTTLVFLTIVASFVLNGHYGRQMGLYQQVGMKGRNTQNFAPPTSKRTY